MTLNRVELIHSTARAKAVVLTEALLARRAVIIDRLGLSKKTNRVVVKTFDALQIEVARTATLRAPLCTWLGCRLIGRISPSDTSRCSVPVTKVPMMKESWATQNHIGLRWSAKLNLRHPTSLAAAAIS